MSLGDSPVKGRPCLSNWLLDWCYHGDSTRRCYSWFDHHGCHHRNAAMVDRAALDYIQ